MHSDCGLSCNGGCMNACSAMCGGSCTSCAGLSNVCSSGYESTDYDTEQIDISDKVTIDMACESCGGTMQLQNEIGHHVLYCPYCHKKRILI